MKPKITIHPLSHKGFTGFVFFKELPGAEDFDGDFNSVTFGDAVLTLAEKGMILDDVVAENDDAKDNGDDDDAGPYAVLIEALESLPDTVLIALEG